MNGIRGKITVNGQPIDEYAKEQREKDFTEHMCRQIFEIHHEIEETEEEFIYKVLDEHLRETGRGSFSKADLYRAVYLLEEERAGRLVYPLPMHYEEGTEEVLRTLEKLYNDFTMRREEEQALDFAIKFIKAHTKKDGIDKMVADCERHVVCKGCPHEKECE